MKYQIIALVSVILWVSACSTKLETLRRVEPSGDPFAQALAREYLAFAETEAQAYDWRDSRHFADKGLRATYDGHVEPEYPEDWDISEEMLPVLRKARKSLIAVLTEERIQADPEHAARMQFTYDCWLEEQEERWQIEQIEDCKGEFMALLEGAKAEKALLHAQETGISVLDNRTPVTWPTETKNMFSYMVFFDFDSHHLDDTALRVLNEVIKDMDAPYRYKVYINGHTDRSGTEAYNLTLSKQRAERVKQYFIDQHAVAKQIELFAFGESDPDIATSDGERERANRRVEIVLGH